MTQNGNGQNTKALEIWGDRSEIRDIAGRCESMIPGILKLPANLRKTASLAMAQISVMAGLNPFIGELWPIPQKSERGGPVDGFQIMVGVKGLRRVAKVQARDLGLVPPYYRPTWRWPNEQESNVMALKAGDVAVVCELELFLPTNHPFFTDGFRRYTVEGIGLVRSNYYGKMEPFAAARKRAESDALKMAFDIPLGGTVIDAEYEAGDWMEMEPRSQIPSLVNRVDPDDWDSAIDILQTDGIIKTPMEVQLALTALKITYVDGDNLGQVMGRVVTYLEEKARDEALPVEPKQRGKNALYKVEPSHVSAKVTQEAVYGAPDRKEAKAKAADPDRKVQTDVCQEELEKVPAEQTHKRPLGGVVARNGKATRRTRRDPGEPPWDPDQVLAYLQDVAKSACDQDAMITDKQEALLSRKGLELYAGTGDEELKLSALLMWAFKVSYIKDLKKCQAGALLDLILDGDRGPDGDYQLHLSAPEEAQKILRVKMEAARQAAMFRDATEQAESSELSA